MWDIIWHILKDLIKPTWRTHDGSESRYVKCPMCGSMMKTRVGETTEVWCPVHDRVYQVWPDGHASVGLEKYKRD